MKKFQKTIGLYISILFLSVVLHSCCDSSGVRIVGGGTIAAYELVNFSEITEVTGAFRISENFETKVAFIEQLNLMNSAMAYSCEDFFFENFLIADELTISCDKDFIYEGTTIQANSDFSNLKGVDAQIFDGYIEVYFHDNVIENFEFEELDYTFKITNKTTDEIEIESEITLAMKL